MTVDARNFGLRADGTTNDRAALQNAIDATPDGEVLVIPPGVYKLGDTPAAVRGLWLADRDQALDTPHSASLILRRRRKLTITAHGATFNSADGYALYAYRCVDCRWIGGRFAGDLRHKKGAREASAIVVARSANCWVENTGFDQFYRNLFFLRSSASGARHCRSTDAGYFCYYGSGRLDVPMEHGEKWSADDILFDSCYAQGGRYGNFFLERAMAVKCVSENCGRQGVSAAHISTSNNPFVFRNSSIVETSDQNSGDSVKGVVVSAGGHFLSIGKAGVDGTRVIGNTITGCRKGIEIVAASNTLVQANTVRGFYVAGIHAYTRRVGGSEARLVNAIIANNIVGPFSNDSRLAGSNYDTKAAIAVESNDGVAIEKAIVVSNVIDGNGRGSITPTGTWYELSSNDPDVDIGPNDFRGTGAQRRVPARPPLPRA